jgi:hypothetical protein
MDRRAQLAEGDSGAQVLADAGIKLRRQGSEHPNLPSAQCTCRRVLAGLIGLKRHIPARLPSATKTATPHTELAG